ncbi:MAG: adenylyltransferase/cytidyltransferase family protein [Patescibacteria group bacterium]
MSKAKKTVVAVSGGFDPPHVGHVRMFEAAKKLGDELVVILNNDNWLRRKKRLVFMPENERKKMIESLKPVDRVILTKHIPNTDDMSVCEALKELRPDVFANGGDRTAGTIPENAVCAAIGCEAVFGVGKGGKVQSSSWLLENYKKALMDGDAGKKRLS